MPLPKDSPASTTTATGEEDAPDANGGSGGDSCYLLPWGPHYRGSWGSRRLSWDN